VIEIERNSPQLRNRNRTMVVPSAAGSSGYSLRPLRVCAWCIPRCPVEVSHGICSKHYREMMSDWETKQGHMVTVTSEPTHPLVKVV
jgi:hypothetical protein